MCQSRVEGRWIWVSPLLGWPCLLSDESHSKQSGGGCWHCSTTTHVAGNCLSAPSSQRTVECQLDSEGLLLALLLPLLCCWSPWPQHNAQYSDLYTEIDRQICARIYVGRIGIYCGLCSSLRPVPWRQGVGHCFFFVNSESDWVYSRPTGEHCSVIFWLNKIQNSKIIVDLKSSLVTLLHTMGWNFCPFSMNAIAFCQ